MEKIKRFIDCYVPVTTCSLRCHYCYITQHRLFGGKLPEFEYSPKYVRRCLSKKRLGGTCLFNFCGGGETLLVPQLLDYVKELLEEGHYVMIVTNATVSSAFSRISLWPQDLTSHLFFKFSYHYMQLKERNLLDVFFRNVCLMRSVGCSFTLEATPSDEMIPYSDEMIHAAIDHVGAENHITVARDERQPDELPILTSMSIEEYKKTWECFHSNLFTYKLSIFGVKRHEFCYAGAWSLYLNFQTGEATQCYCTFIKQNIFGNPEEDIKWTPIGNNCKEKHCYNGHAFLALGLIPELKAPTYAELRNRKCKDGTEWLQPEMKAFMQTKLYDSNDEYTPWQKIKSNYEIAKIVYQNICVNNEQ